MKERKTRWVTHGALSVVVAAAMVVVILFLPHGVGAIQRAAYPKKYSEYVEYYAEKYHLDQYLVYSIIKTESGFRADAVSNVDARGLMQITEQTFDWIKTKIAPNEAITFDDMYDPETNIRFGVYLLSVCMARYYEDVSTAAAAYHSGIGKVDSLLEQKEYSEDGKVLFSFPYEQMNHYVRKVNANYKSYQSIYGG